MSRQNWNWIVDDYDGIIWADGETYANACEIARDLSIENPGMSYYAKPVDPETNKVGSSHFKAYVDPTCIP